MLSERLHPEKSARVIYHYCSAPALLSIVKCRTIRFSDVTLLNDGQEGAWGYRVFDRAAEQLSKTNPPEGKPPITPEFFQCIKERWLSLSVKSRHMVACFSADGDSLSQWRAYADDGRGFAIGFKAGETRAQLPIQMYDVLYDERQQIQEMVRAVGSTWLEFIDKGRDYDAPWFMKRCGDLTASSIALKNPAWRDEQEIRCHHMVAADASAEKWHLIDPGGKTEAGVAVPQQIQFEARGGTIVPYMDLPFIVSQERHPIAEIVMGPRCPTDESTLRFLMGGEGYGAVAIRFAGSAYRR